MARALGPGFQVVEERLRGRTLRRPWRSSPSTPRCSKAGPIRRCACRPPIERSPRDAGSDSSTRASCSPLDGIHYAPDQHAILGAAMAEAARMLLA